MVFFYLLISTMTVTEHPLWAQFIGELTAVKYLGGVCLFYALLYWCVRRTRVRLLSTWQARLFVLLYAIVVASWTMKSARVVSWELSPFMTYTSVALLFVITVVLVDSLERLRWVLLSAIGSVAVGSAYVVRAWQKYHHLYEGYRPGHVVGDPNYFSATALVCVPLAFYLMMSARRRWERWFCAGCLGVTLLAMTFAASRGGFLGLAAGLLCVVWRSRRRLRNMVLVGALLVPLNLLVPSSPVERLLYPDPEDVQAGENRLVLWQAALRMIGEHPIQGIGLGNFRAMVVWYQKPGERFEGVSHNSYLTLAAEMGLPALVTFLGMLFCCLRTLGRTYRQACESGSSLLRDAAAGIQAGMIGSAAAMFFVSGMNGKLFWLMAFLSMCMPLLTRCAVLQRQRGQGHRAA